MVEGKGAMKANMKMGILPIFIALIIGGVLIAGAGGYEGYGYYASNKLVKEGDKLMGEGDYAGAMAAYQKAENKFKFTKKKVASKKEQAQALKAEDDNYKSGEANFGEGEWQKCLEYFGQVTSKFPKYGEAQARYSDCEKKIAEEKAATAAATAAQGNSNTNSSSGGSKSSNSSRRSSSSSSGSSASTSGSGSGGSQTQARPVLYLPFSVNPPRISPMGETLYHSGPQGHPGIDFIWLTTEGNVSIIASMDATVTAVRASEAHAGAYDVTTQNGIYGVDYTEMGSVASGINVGGTVHIGDVVGYAYHPPEFGDTPNYKMVHWQFGYEAEHPEFYQGVATRLCPMAYFAASAKSAIESLWATTDWSGVDMKGNAPNLCSGYYAGKDS